MLKRWMVLGCLFVGLLSSCESVPAVAKTSRGEVFRGTASTSSMGGTFSLYGHGGRSMTGSYRSLSGDEPGTFKFTVSDGRTGTGTMRRSGPKNGYGVGRFENGGTCRFSYGE